MMIILHVMLQHSPFIIIQVNKAWIISTFYKLWTANRIAKMYERQTKQVDISIYFFYMLRRKCMLKPWTVQNNKQHKKIGRIHIQPVVLYFFFIIRIVVYSCKLYVARSSNKHNRNKICFPIDALCCACLIW